jgi:hypothetical protein
MGVKKSQLILTAEKRQKTTPAALPSEKPAGW